MAGRFEDMARSAAELNNLVTKDDLPSWRGHADLFSGLALIWRGEKEEGLVQARRGIKRLLDAHAFSNCWFILFAQACFENGRLDEAAEMLALVRPSLAQGDVRFAAEFHRVDAAVALAGGGSVAEARERLEDALASPGRKKRSCLSTASGATSTCCRRAIPRAGRLMRRGSRLQGQQPINPPLTTHPARLA